MELQEVSMTFQYLSCCSECPFNPERGTEKITEGSCTWESYNTSRESWMGQCQKKSSDNLQGSNVRLLRTPDKQTNKQMFFFHQMMDINRNTVMMQSVLCAASNILGFSQEAILKPQYKYKEMEGQRSGTIQKLPSFHFLEAVYGI